MENNVWYNRTLHLSHRNLLVISLFAVWIGLSASGDSIYPAAVEELRPYCESILDQRVVDEGNVVTAGGVSAPIDLGFYLVERIAGKMIRARIAQQMDYVCG
jgi:cyclohexyl-isocyanide hydratase